MKKLLFLALLALPFIVKAQQTAATPEQPYIEVTGTAEMKVVPDIIYITITLKDKVVNRNTYPITEQEQKLRSILTSQSISLDNLKLSDASSDIIMYKRKEKGVEETKIYILKVSTAVQASAVFKGLHDNNIKEAEITKTDHTQITELNKQVRINAIKAAKDKAAYLLAAIGEEPGKPIVITEEKMPAVFENQRANYYSANAVSYDGVPDYLDADFKEITIKFSYYVKYAIK